MMTIDINKISPLSIMTIVMIFFATVSPGALFLFVYAREMFLGMDTFKIILLSFGITGPFWLLNTFPYILWERSLIKELKSNSSLIACIAGTIWTVPIVYFPFVSYFFFGWGARKTCLIMIALELIMLVVMYLTEIYNRTTSKI
ncbi:hypothetical protein [Algoriphagus sp.]|uniref:hypothetical protein n=1 Tax=Algoriphagus sp. TaxID=1872435 RepID=UPI003F721A49